MKILVTENLLKYEDILAGLTQPEHGAQIIFAGIVRNLNHGQKVLAVSYDAHKRMTEKVFSEISNEALKKWGKSLDVNIFHRIGKLYVGEISVLIAVSSVHRDEAYEVSRYIIEQIKLRAPIWKKEHYENGETEWLKGHELCKSSHSYSL